MDEPIKLPLPVQRTLRSLTSGKGSFPRLLPKLGPAFPPFVLQLPQMPSRDLFLSILEDNDVDPEDPLAQSLLQCFDDGPRIVRVLTPSGQGDAMTLDFIRGEKATHHPILKLVFHALLYGENEYCVRDLPQQSHEERLSGHLLSKLYSALSFSASAIENAGVDLYGMPVNFDLSYHDLSTHNRERLTGSDFGIVLHIDLPDLGTLVHAAVFQAKKLGSSRSYLPQQQLEAQMSFAGRGAYCCFYDVGCDSPLPPAVVKTKTVLEGGHSGRASINYSRASIQEAGLPLSLFLIWLIEDSERGATFSSLHEAAHFMRNGSGEEVNLEDYPGPSRVFAISLRTRNLSGTQDMRNLQDLFRLEDTRTRLEGRPDEE